MLPCDALECTLRLMVFRCLGIEYVLNALAFCAWAALGVDAV